MENRNKNMIDDSRHLPALECLPIDGGWHSESSTFSKWLDLLVQHGSDLVQYRNRDGLQQFRLTPKGISMREAKEARVLETECWAR